MVTHVAYEEYRFRNSEECLAAIRRFVDLGWQISQVRGPADGPFVVLVRKDEVVA